MLQLMSSCEVTAQQRHDELLSTLMAAEKAEHELHKNIELLKNIRYRIFSLCVLSADMSLMKNIHDQLVVLQHCATAAILSRSVLAAGVCVVLSASSHSLVNTQS